jgi:DNA modification methylase
MTPVGPLTQPNRLPVPGLKKKDLVGIPWRVAFALQDDGWWLRSDIIVSKRNPMPESVKDRPTKAHEYLFLLTRSERYYYDAEAIAEPSSYADEAKYDNGQNGLHSGVSHAGSGSSTRKFKAKKFPTGWHQNQRDPDTLWQRRKGTGHAKPHNGEALNATSHHWPYVTRNKRSVWTLKTQPYPDAHFATMPEDLVKPCVLAGSRPGNLILDPFAGSGTTGKVALELGRRAILIELSAAYVQLIKQRTMVTVGMF